MNAYFFLLLLSCVGGRVLRIPDQDVELEKSRKEKENTNLADALGNNFKREEASARLKAKDKPKVCERESS